MKRIAFSLWAFFILGMAVDAYEATAHVNNYIAAAIGVAVALLQYGTAKWIHRSEA